MITVVGCGFLGGLFVEEICKRSFAFHEEIDLKLIDPDDVQNRNVANQIFTLVDLHHSKVSVLGNRVTGYGLNVEALAERVEESNIDDLLAETSILVCAVDNIPTRQLLWKYAVGMDLPLLTMGISQGGTGGVEWTHFSKGFDTNPFSPMRLASLSDEKVEALGEVGHLPPCELVGFRGLGLNVALAAAKALWIYKGWDAEKHVFPEAKGEPGTMTTWEATNMSHKLTGASQ